MSTQKLKMDSTSHKNYFKSPDSLSDVVTLIVYLEETDEVLLTCNEYKEFTLPFMKVIKNEWYASAVELLKQLIGITIVSSYELYRIIRIWIPYHRNINIFNVMFLINITKEMTIKIKLNVKYRLKLKLLTLKEVEKNSKHYIFKPKVELILMDFRKQNENLDIIVELLEKDVIYNKNTINNPNYKFDELFLSIGLSYDEQCKFYRDFMLLCYPNIHMNSRIFTNLISTHYDWSINDAMDLFSAADLYNKNYLSYNDYLFICIACDPLTKHTDYSAELRSIYLFNFIDKNKKNYLDLNDIKTLFQLIYKAKKLNNDNKILLQDVEHFTHSMGLTNNFKIELDTFLKAIGDLKIRGTSLLLRFNNKITNYIYSLNDNIVKDTNEDKPSLSVRPSLYSIKSAHSVNGTFYYRPPTNCVLAVHTIKLKKFGEVIDVVELQRMKAWVTPSSIKPIHNIRDSKSVIKFKENTSENNIINSLRFFSQMVIDEKRNVIVKEAFSWKDFNLVNFGQAVINVSQDLLEKIKIEPRLVALTSPVYVLGDLHGNFPDLMYFERLLWHLSPTLNPCTLLFLGDYVDRGPHGVEVIAYLFSYKLQNCNKICLLRGNHEIREIQKTFTFYNECLTKFGESLGFNVWTAINNVFDAMPIVAVIDNKIFCCHGGIPPPWLCPVINNILHIPNPLPLPDTQSQLAWNLLWNDPVKHISSDMLLNELNSKQGFANNHRRGTGHVFSALALDKFLSINGLSHVIRAHEAQAFGCHVQFSGKLLTVFSSSNYCGGNNDAACILCDNGKIRFLRIDSESNR